MELVYPKILARSIVTGSGERAALVAQRVLTRRDQETGFTSREFYFGLFESSKFLSSDLIESIKSWTA